MTPPGRPEHVQGFDLINQMTSYAPPNASLPVASTSYDYDLDRALTTVTRPDGVVLTHSYLANGQLDRISHSGGFIDYDYYTTTNTSGAAAGRVSQIQGPHGTNVSFAYDGQLTRGMTWSGGVVGGVSWTFNTDFRPTLETVTGATGSSAVRFGYDADTVAEFARGG